VIVITRWRGAGVVIIVLFFLVFIRIGKQESVVPVILGLQRWG
jgi:hypothetical protein